MKITKCKEIDASDVIAPGVKNVTKKVLLGPEEGSNNIALRHFSLAPGGYSPYHKHDFEHLVQVQSGTGIFTDDQGGKHHVEVGDNIYIHNNEQHSFSNESESDFEFLCIILNQS